MTAAKAEERRSHASLGSIIRFLCIFLAFAAKPLFAIKPNVVRVAILSKVDVELAVYWINSWKLNELVRQKEEAIVARGSLNVDSYKSHSFLIIEEEHIEGLTKFTSDIWNPKIMTMFTMGEFDLEARIFRDEQGNLKVDLESALTRTEALMTAATETCRKNPEVMKAAAKQRGIAAAEGSCVIGAAGDPNEMTPEFSACLTRVVAEDLAKKENEAIKNMRMLEAVGDRARNYTCVDPDMETTNTSLSTMTWVDPDGGLSYNAKVFLDEPSAKIYLLDNFATREECQSLMKKASPHLQDATVNAGAGKSELSSARRAKAGGVNAELDDPKSITAPLYRRGYAFANHVTGYNMDMAGQEGFSVIKYGPNDEYRPHCDGDCTGAEHQQGGRIATMVIYCEAPKLGGGTTFSSSDVFVKSKAGQAVFFSYLGPNNRTDTGRTRHSGCPIIEGTKWIATLWMRRGVSAERDWRYFDPSGMPSSFAISRTKGEISKEDEALVNAQRSVVDGPEKANSGMTETVTVNEGVDESNCGEGSTCNEITSTGGGGGGAEKVDAGVLGGIADTLSSLWS